MIVLSTPHGTYELPVTSLSISLREFLLQKQIPYNAVAFYTKDNDGQAHKFVGITKTLAEILSQHPTLVIRSDRNIDLIGMINAPQIRQINEKQAVSEYLFNQFKPENQQVYQQFTQEDCKAFVKEKVGKFIESQRIDFNKPLVFGISGGGDSNTLQEAFIANGFPKKNILPVFIKGIPDIDKGEARARQVTEAQGLELIVIEAYQIDELLGRTNRDGRWASHFEDHYPEGDLEIIGTLAIRLGLTYVKDQYQAQGCVTGLNLEDILCEGMLSLFRGEMPPSFPKRQIGPTNFFYPLYEIPKQLLDGCHPKLSLENYIQRFPNELIWRTVAYHTVQTIASNLPGAEYRLLNGLKKLSEAYQIDNRYVYDDDLGFYVEQQLDDRTKALWLQFISNKD